MMMSAAPKEGADKAHVGVTFKRLSYVLHTARLDPDEGDGDHVHAEPQGVAHRGDADKAGLYQATHPRPHGGLGHV